MIYLLILLVGLLCALSFYAGWNAGGRYSIRKFTEDPDPDRECEDDPWNRFYLCDECANKIARAAGIPPAPARIMRSKSAGKNLET